MTKPLIQVRGLRRAFPITKGMLIHRRIGEIVAIDDLNFDIQEGETLGCVGGSGSGKSTLGRLILNLIRPDAGEILFDGVALNSLPPSKARSYRRHLQIVFQDPLQSLNPRRTVAENIVRPMLNFGISRRQAFERARELLAIVGLETAHANRYPHQFSGGQCQRIGIARALALNPRFLFLDEPVSALDVSIQAQILNLLQEIQEKFNLTYFFVANDLKVVKHISDRIMILYQGRILELGTAEDVYNDALHPFTRSFLESVLHMGSGDTWEKAALRSERLANLARDDLVTIAASKRTGCIYYPACSERFGPCPIVSPPLREARQEHSVACHLYDSAMVGREAQEKSEKAI
jgi:ABC-type oligopeptide transport system ATPase subunit